MTHDEVTAAMKAEGAWVETAARGWWDWGATMRKATGHGREWDELDEDERALVRSRVRTALAPVVPEIRASVAAEIVALGDTDYEAAKADPATLRSSSYREGFLDGHDRAGRVAEQYAARLTAATEVRCKCGFGGFHDDGNLRCDQNAATTEPSPSKDGDS